MLNRQALVRSLDSIIEAGKQPLVEDTVRGYVVLYNDTLKYIQAHINESDVLKDLYPKFPVIEFKDFTKPSAKARAFLFRVLDQLTTPRSGFTIASNEPIIQNYFNDIQEKIPTINILASELIMRLGD